MRYHQYDPSEWFNELIIVVDAASAMFKLAGTIGKTQVTCYFHLIQAQELWHTAS